MAITHVHTRTGGASGTTSAQVFAPFGVADGDVMVAVAQSGSSGATLTPPSGWTQLQTRTNSTANYRGYVWYKVAGASEPSAYTFAASGNAWFDVVISAFRGCDATTPIDTSAQADDGTRDAPAVAAARATNWLVSTWGYRGGADWVAPPSMTERGESNVGSSISRVMLATEPLGASGATGTRTASGGGTPAIKFSVSLNGPANTAPNAPTLTAPADAATIDRNSTQRFDWDFSDPDPGDTQSKYNLYWRPVGAGTWTMVTGTTPNTYHDFAGGTFTAGDHEWQVETYDAQGVLGARSASSFFTAANAPEEPTITDPINGATVSSTHTVAWATPDQDSYQIRRVADNAGAADGTTVYYDSGEQVTTTARSHTLTFATNNRYEHIQVRQKRDGLWSQWASVRVQVAYTPPPTPLVSLLADVDAGSLVVTVTNPAPGAGEPAVNYNDIYVNDGDGEFRAATMVVPNSSWTYWLPRAQHDYAGNVRVVAVADNGVTASS